MSEQTPSGKILQHGEGLGVASPELVRRRARELAVINGRDPDAFTEQDWAQAKVELHGGHDFEHGEDAPELAQGATAASEEDTHRVNHQIVETPENLGEELFAEGMDEAVHEQMLEARRDQDSDDS